MLFVPGNVTGLPTIQMLVRWWLYDHNISEVPGSLELSEAPDVGDFDAYAAYVERKGDWDIYELTGGPGLGHHISICDDYEQLREGRSTASLSVPSSL